MKITLLFSFVFLYGTSVLFSQNACSKYYPMEEGSTFQYTMYDKKDKVEGVTDYVVSKVENDGGNTMATMKLTYTDDKGKNILNKMIQNCSSDYWTSYANFYLALMYFNDGLNCAKIKELLDKSKSMKTDSELRTQYENFYKTYKNNCG